jgi:hypothetical protein
MSRHPLLQIFAISSVLVFTGPVVQGQTKPVVVSTNPANGAANVSRFLDCITVTFSKPMVGCGMSTQGWLGAGQPGSSCTFSADGKTMAYCRANPAGNPLVQGSTVTGWLNPSPGPPLIKDTDGIYLDPYSFSFTVEAPTAPLIEVTANPSKGFHWPYYLYKPATVKSPAVLFVEPNNTGRTSDDQSLHQSAAYSLINSKKSWADELGTPYLVPTFPRPAWDPYMYTHALDRKTIEATAQGYVRIDLQLIAMIQDARARLAADFGVTVDSKVFMVGASASGSFTSRFVLLHPDIIKAASIGCPGWGPAVPVASFNGKTLPYPEGISDLQSLVQKSFDAAAFKNVPLQVWVGDEDENVDPWWNLSDTTVALVHAAFGGRHLFQRWPRYESAFGLVTDMAQFVVFPRMGHSWASWSYMKEFFERNRTAPRPPLPKPLAYKLYLPHVASDGHWETEIALLNTIAGGTEVQGELQAYRSAGGDPIQTIDFVIPPGGRKEITVGNAFQNPANIAYVVFVSDSGFVSGYTRFNEPGNRVSLPASAAGVTEGWFPKMDNDGWTGLAFVNVDSADANVVLEAYDQYGGQVARQQLPRVKPGEKVVGLTVQLFVNADLSRAQYFCFTSDRAVVGFSVSRSQDGTKLDGMLATPRYLRTRISDLVR